MVEGDAPGLKRRRLTPLSFGWGSPRTRPRGTVTPPQKKREQNLDSSVCLHHHVSRSRQPLATVLVALLTDRVGLHLMASRGVMPSAGRETQPSSTTRAAVYGASKGGRWHSSHFHVH